MKRFGLVAAIAISLMSCTATVAAQEQFPTHPITLIVPFPAGGVVDIVARMVGEKMATALGTSIVVENRPGAGGTIGAGYVARAKPDGYTLLLGGSATQIFGPALYKKLPYDAQRSFAPIGQISSAPLVMVLGSKVKADSMQELIAYLKKRQAKALYCSNGNGTFPHLAAELFKQSYGLSATHIPYSGGPGCMTALIAGDVDFSINHIPIVQGLVKGGKLHALATTGMTRSVAFPDLPTMDELGIKGLEVNVWWGLFAPAGTAAPIVDKLNSALKSALADKAAKARLAAQGDEVSYSTPQDFSRFLGAETQKWTAVVKKANLTIN